MPESQFDDAQLPSPADEPCARAPLKIEQPLEPPASAPDRQSVQDQQAEQRPEAPAAERSAAREPSPPGLMLGQKLAPNFDVKKGPIINSSNHRGDFMRFSRECKNANRCPDSLHSRFSDKLQRMQLFNEWFYNGQDMQRLQVLLTRQETFHKVLRENMGFKTRDDLLVLYHNKEKRVAELIARKIVLGHWRPHPEFPDCVDMVQYWVRLDTTMSTEHGQLDVLQIQILTEIDEASLQSMGSDIVVPGLRVGESCSAMPGPADIGTARPSMIAASSAQDPVAHAVAATEKPPALSHPQQLEKQPPITEPQQIAKAAPPWGEANPPRKQARKATRSLPDSPLKKAQMVVKTMEKYIANLAAMALRLSACASQQELVGKVNGWNNRAERIYVKLSALTKSGANDDGVYTETLTEFSQLKSEAKDDIAEAEGVAAGIQRGTAKVKKTSWVLKPQRKARQGSLEFDVLFSLVHA